MKTISSKEAFSILKPETVVFVITYDENHHRPSGMVAGWCMKCSTQPYMLAVAIWKENYTYQLISQAKEFIIAIPNQSMKKYIDVFGGKHGNDVDKFALTQIETEPAMHIDLPLLSEATINFECKLVTSVQTGDHSIFVGEVLDTHANPNKGVLINMGKVGEERIFQEFKLP